jgi:hypothetical protein
MKSSFFAVALSVPAAFLLAFAGLLVGAELAPFFASNTFLPVFLIPLALNIGVGYLLVKRKLNVSAGQIILVAGTIASIALPLIIL